MDGINLMVKIRVPIELFKFTAAETTNEDNEL